MGAAEVRHEAGDGVLTAELVAVEAAIAELVPEQRFGVGGGLTEVARGVAGAHGGRIASPHRPLSILRAGGGCGAAGWGL